jgi:hypothetical protein
MSKTTTATILSLALLPGFASTIYACTGPEGCNGSSNGPEGVTWASMDCQDVGAAGWTVSCNGSDVIVIEPDPGNPFQGSIKLVYYPTRVCGTGETGCTNLPAHYVCFDAWQYETHHCAAGGGSVFHLNPPCYKDWACAGQTSPPRGD